MRRRRYSLRRPVSCNHLYTYIYTYISVRVLCHLIVSCLLCCRLCSLCPSVPVRVTARSSFFLSLCPLSSSISPSKNGPVVPPSSPRTRVATRHRVAAMRRPRDGQSLARKMWLRATYISQETAETRGQGHNQDAWPRARPRHAAESTTEIWPRDGDSIERGPRDNRRRDSWPSDD